MRALSTAFALSLALTGAALADNTDHLQTVLDEAVERAERPIVTGTSDGGTAVETINTESGWRDEAAEHPAYRPPFLADGGE